MGVAGHARAGRAALTVTGSARTSWWTLFVVCLGTFMLLLDISIVNVALPAIMEDLGASFTDLQWVIDAYALALAAFMLTAGTFADRLGRRRVYLAGVTLFTVASVLCGLASDPLQLNVSRFVQGVGGAIMYATALAIIADAYDGRERGIAIGLWGATVGGALAIGPLVGGIITDGLGWEWIFFVNLPVGVLLLVLVRAKVAESRDPNARRTDWPGLVTFSTALAALVYGLIRGNELGWGSPAIVALLGGAAALLAAFVVLELRRPDPMLDFALLRKPTFAGGAIAALCLHGSIISLFLFFTLYFQNVLGYTPLETGLRFLPVTVVAFAVAPLAGRLTGVVPMRAVLSFGLLCVGAGCGLAAGVDARDDWTALLGGMVLAGAGVGIMNPAIASVAIGVVTPERSGMASGINNTFRQVGMAMGIAVLGAVFQARVESKASELLAGSPVAGSAERIAEAIASGGDAGAAGALPPPVRDLVAGAARQAFVTGLNDILVLAAVIALTGAVLALVLVRARDFVTAAPEEPAPAITAGAEAATTTAGSSR